MVIMEVPVNAFPVYQFQIFVRPMVTCLVNVLEQEDPTNLNSL